ncbi:LacI family DNA-binding transcriptional regulator [Bifidobacterium oedipodis]|uniref:LacI family transcriptional regulator n=1 Tax=Bifidobacterium oedipodis TaxID=2675322 RepID=A0A7Y0HU72_9BIFI|nr:LacI family DNA-binding transcriptional regulator [Bifidobacterium sp. DSM 109957]NMM94877.1 LacI family transcriptional regulator [Bifidobacterium sp. DSM 109957]
MNTSDIHDVAKAAGVSISTVSRAFTRPDLVKKSTRDKVLQAADKLNFNISRSAGTLKTGRTNRVALLMNEEITSWFNAHVFAGLESVLHDAGYDISLYQHIDTASTRRDFFTTLPVRRNVDAVFVASFAVDPEEAAQLKRINVPIIGINIPKTDSFDASVSIDDEAGMRTAAQHLIALGHRHIVYACSAASDTIDASIDARGRGFINACEDAQRAGRDIQWQVLTVPRGSDIADSALAALLSLPEFPDAICCQMDMIAIPLVMKLQRYGHITPRDYSIIGFDDSHYADTANLTTMRQDPWAMGAAAARKALKLIDGEPLDEAHTVLRPQLTLRGTDAPFVPQS